MARNLFFHASNDLDRLADFLCEELRAPLSSPFLKETLVVQSQGMARWLSLKLAARRGLCMNADFVFPRRFIDRTLVSLGAIPPEELFHSKELLTWRIENLLPELLDRSEFEPIRQYLADPRDALKRFQLAEKIASVFDQYIVYRPDFIRDWESGRRADGWQSVLWNRLAKDGAMGVLLAREIERLDFSKPPPLPGLAPPERVSIFGITTLPPLYLEVLRRLAERIPVHLFLLQPTEVFWGDLLSDKEADFVVRKASGKLGRPVARDDLLLAQGNPLLTSLGRQGREFFNLVIEMDFHPARESFRPIAEDSLLHTVQARIFEAVEAPASPRARRRFDPNDRSIELHSCHSRMREIETLHDRILDWLNGGPDRLPRDILVMAPDIEIYAPYINAVFDHPENDSHRLPFSIADRKPRSENQVTDLFFKVLDLSGSRFTSRQVLSVLENPVMRARFGLDDARLATIRRWIVATRISWGIDAAHRAREFGVPDLPEGTWRHGMERLLLGCAMRGADRGLFEGRLPYDEIEGGGDRQTLGRFCSALECLFDLHARLGQDRPLKAWVALLTDLLNRLTPESESFQTQARAMRHAIDSLREAADRQVSEKPVGRPVIAHHLGRIVEEGAWEGGYLTGGITFCSLKPMRSIPSRIIHLIGLNEEDFPRRPARLGFDLTARDRRLGDRSWRDDDRYLFLETLLSARAALSISYVGQSIRDRTEFLPSVTVCELLDFLDGVFDFPEGNARRQLAVRHRLQPFHSAYFSAKEALFSFSQANLAAARRLQAPPESPGPFVTERIPAPGDSQSVDVQELLAFFRHPCRYLVEKRLDIRLEEDTDEVREEEGYDLDRLESYRHRDELTEKFLGGDEPVPADWEVYNARGGLPLGVAGRVLHESIAEEARRLGRAVKQLEGKAAPRIEEVAVSLDGFTVTGRIGPVFGDRLLHYRCAKVKPTDRLAAWIKHLLLSVARPGSVVETMVLGTDQVERLKPVAEAEERLRELLRTFAQGQEIPVPFFPEVSCEYAVYQVRPGRKKRTPLEAARSKWLPQEYAGASAASEDLYNRACFGHRLPDPLDEEFVNLAMTVCGPLVEHLEEVSS